MSSLHTSLLPHIPFDYRHVDPSNPPLLCLTPSTPITCRGGAPYHRAGQRPGPRRAHAVGGIWQATTRPPHQETVPRCVLLFCSLLLASVLSSLLPSLLQVAFFLGRPAVLYVAFFFFTFTAVITCPSTPLLFVFSSSSVRLLFFFSPSRINILYSYIIVPCPLPPRNFILVL